MKLYIHEMMPIDFGWGHLDTLEQHYASYGEWAFVALEDIVEVAQTFIHKEREVLRGAIHVGFMPSEGRFVPYLAFKVDNNGTTYIICEQLLNENVASLIDTLG